MRGTVIWSTMAWKSSATLSHSEMRILSRPDSAWASFICVALATIDESVFVSEQSAFAQHVPKSAQRFCARFMSDAPPVPIVSPVPSREPA